MRRSIFIVAALALLTGCNTMVEKPFQYVQVVTPGVNGAECMLKSKNAEYVVTTPHSVLIDRSPETLLVTCNKAYYKEGSVKAESKIRMWRSGLNVFNGVVPGTAWDVLDNSIYDYPDVITVPMEFDQATYDEAQDSIGDAPEPMRKKEVELPAEPAVPETKADKAFDGALHK